MRRSLFFNRLTWIPGNFFTVATTGVAAVELGKYLGATDRTFGLLAAAPLVATLFQLPGSLTVEWLRVRKKIYVSAVLVCRALYVFLGILPWIAPRDVAWPAMLMVLLVFVASSLANFGSQAWVNWMADLVPTRMQGNYFARCSRVGAAVNALTAVSIAILLDISHQPWLASAMEPVLRSTAMTPLIVLVSIVFILGGAVGIFDPLALLKVDEPPMKAARDEPLIQRLARPLRDTVFLRYVAYWGLWNVAGGFCGWLWWLNILDFFAREQALGHRHWWDNHTYVAATMIMTVAYAAGQFIGYPMWGRAIDRFGRKPVLFLSSTINTLNWFTWIFISPMLFPWLFFLHLSSGIVGGGQDLASFNMMLQFNRRGGSGYQAIGSIAFSLAAALGALAASNISEVLRARDWHWTFAPGTAWEHTFNRYAVLILIGITLKYAADFLLLPLVKDTVDKPAGHALRFVAQSTYGTLNSMLMVPLRTTIGATARGLEMVRQRWR